MFKPKELDIYEDDQNLTISYKWFKPYSLFLIGFAVFWNAFMIMALTTGAPILFLLFHLIAGGLIGYTALCYLFNKTIIDVSYDQLTIVHRPFPWWRGARKLNTDNIEQLYVKEKRHSGKHGTSYTYILLAKLKDGKNITLLETGETSSEMYQTLEERLEAYIGINDYPIKGEYGNKNATTNTQQAPKKPRRRRKTSEGDHALYDLEEGEVMMVQSKSLTVNHITQYDWKTGDTDKLFQLLSTGNKQNLLFVKKKKGIYTTFVEQELPLHKAETFGFNEQDPPVALKYNGVQYLKSSYNEGTAFPGDIVEGIIAKEWIYIDSNTGNQLRVEEKDSILTFYEGHPVPESYFSNPIHDELELKELDAEMELREDNIWDEEFE